MSNAKNKNVETKANETVETKATQSGQPDTNNVGQSIEKLGAKETTEVGETVSIESPTKVTKEQYEAIVTKGQTIVKALLSNQLELAVFCVENDENMAYKVPTTETGAQKYNDVSEWLNAEFGISKTMKTIGAYAKVIHIFGIKDKDGHYMLDEKYKKYSIQKLDEIQRLPDFKTRTDLEKLEAESGIYPEMSLTDLREVLAKRKEDSLTEEQKQKRDEKKAEAKKKAEKKKTEVEDLKHEVETVKDDRQLLFEFITRWYGYSKDEKMTDKDFRKEYTKAVLEFSKEFDLGKVEVPVKETEVK